MKTADWIPAFLPLLVLIFATGPAQAIADPAQSVTLCDQHGYQVRLVVSAEPSLADPAWLRLEIENVDARHEIVGNLHYRVDYKAHADHAQTSWSGGLCSGSTFQVFGQAQLPHRIPRGATRMAHEPLTNMAGARLVSASQLSETGDRMPIKVHATAHFSLNVSHGGNSTGVSMKTPTEGLPFSFMWAAIRTNDTPQLETTIRYWYQDAKAEQDAGGQNAKRKSLNSSAYHRIAVRAPVIAAILSLPDLTPHFTDELLQDIAELERHFEVTFAAKKILFDRDNNYAPYLEAYAQLIAGWQQVCEMRRTGFWHPDLFNALIARASSPHDDGNTNSFGVSSTALRVLEDHRSSWEHDEVKVAAFDKAHRTYRWKRFLNDYAKSLTLILAVAAIAMAWAVRNRIALRLPPESRQ